MTRNSLQLINPWPSNSWSNWNFKMLAFEEGGKPENLEKNPRSKSENQQQTQSTYEAGSGNRTRDTLVVASALTTATPLQCNVCQNYTIIRVHVYIAWYDYIETSVTCCFVHMFYHFDCQNVSSMFRVIIWNLVVRWERWLLLNKKWQRPWWNRLTWKK